MIALIQRVARAHVEVQGHAVGAIDRGILALIGVETGSYADGFVEVTGADLAEGLDVVVPS